MDQYVWHKLTINYTVFEMFFPLRCWILHSTLYQYCSTLYEQELVGCYCIHRVMPVDNFQNYPCYILACRRTWNYMETCSKEIRTENTLAFRMDRGNAVAADFVLEHTLRLNLWRILFYTCKRSRVVCLRSVHRPFLSLDPSTIQNYNVVHTCARQL